MNESSEPTAHQLAAAEEMEKAGYLMSGSAGCVADIKRAIAAIIAKHEQGANERQLREALEAVLTISKRIVKAIPEYHYEMELVRKALHAAESPPSK